MQEINCENHDDATMKLQKYKNNLKIVYFKINASNNLTE